ncbi:hypothetical protein ACFL60_04785 [Candidatus Omnitrophota bacterium]
MKNKTRRVFLKSGVLAGTGLMLNGVCPDTCVSGMKSVSGSFVFQGLKGSVNLTLDNEVSNDSVLDITVTAISEKKALARIRFSTGQELIVKRFSVEAAVPLKDVNRIWYSQQLDGMGQHAYMSLPWGVEIPAAGHQGSFIAAVQNRHGKNRGLVAFRNQTGDGSLYYRIEYGGESFRMTLNRFAEGRTYRLDDLNETLYIDLDDISRHNAVSQFVEWYDTEWGLSYDTPRQCYEPAFNTWYPIKNEQKVETIERLARTCSSLGIKTFEIDAGWFRNTGTWEPDTDKIPDLRGTIRTLQSMGLKVIVWYNPFDSGGDKKLEHMQTIVDGKPTGKLCPRCGEARERAAEYAKRLMELYELDGLKIDFLDASHAAAPLVNCEASHKHSYDFVSDGIREAMRLMADAVRDVKSDALIEYRLNYSNIANRQYANCYRGQDAPSDIDLVRRHLALLRSWCRGVAPHADYAYWTAGESDENVARFMATVSLYGVPTLSVDFDVLPESHVSIIKAWISFYQKHKQNLIDVTFDPLSDDFHFSAARISSSGTTYIPCFLRRWPSLIHIESKSSDTIVLFNGTAYPQAVTCLEGIKGSYRLSEAGMTLRMQKQERLLTSSGSLQLSHPVETGGMIILERM